LTRKRKSESEFKVFLTLLRGFIRAKLKRASWLTSFAIKPRDLSEDHFMQTKVGLFLNLLAQEGFVKPLNHGRPRRYLLKRILIEWARICSYPRCSPDCMLRGVCPYHKLGFEGEEVDD